MNRNYLQHEDASWEIGSGRMPPAYLDSVVKDDERLLWAAAVRSTAFTAWLLWLGVITALLAGAMAYDAPWNQTVEEYCLNDYSRSCANFYQVLWPGAVIFMVFAMTCLGLVFLFRSRPWSIFYGITTLRAVVAYSNRPGTFSSLPLEGVTARRVFPGGVRFGKSNMNPMFIGLSRHDANRAIYWANEGRLRREYPVGAEQ